MPAVIRTRPLAASRIAAALVLTALATAAMAMTFGLSMTMTASAQEHEPEGPRERRPREPGLPREHGRPAERVTFPSADGQTTLIGYVFAPAGGSATRHPAIVLMHGRSGAYSTLAHERYDATTLSQRHQMWAHLWAASGYVAIMVDGFGPRGFPQGFPRFSYNDRPAALDEVNVRPLDAYGALRYLRTRPDVIADRIGLQGWSNGGSATLATMAVDAPDGGVRAESGGFRAALAFYPACGLKDKFKEGGYKPYAPVWVFHGTKDEEVSFRRCATLVERSVEQGGKIEIQLYPDATHDFDDPGRRRQQVLANADAKAAAMGYAQHVFGRMLLSR